MSERDDVIEPEIDSRESPLHEDRRLVARLRAGEEAAFDEFWATHADRIYRFALSRNGGNADAARETVQAGLCKALENLSAYRGTGSLFAWICGICRHDVWARDRTRRRRGPHLSLAVSGLEPWIEALLAPGDDPERALLRTEARRRVHDALDSLPERHARALEWKYAGGLSVREIARRLELSEKAAESLLTRARSAFRDAFAATAGDRASADAGKRGEDR
jgi:RNA polymerase sigma-70 factor (ECF subfamily)